MQAMLMLQGYSQKSTAVQSRPFKSLIGCIGSQGCCNIAYVKNAINAYVAEVLVKEHNAQRRLFKLLIGCIGSQGCCNIARVKNASNAYAAGVLVKEHSAPKQAIEVFDWLLLITRLLQNHTCKAELVEKRMLICRGNAGAAAAVVH